MGNPATQLLPVLIFEPTIGTYKAVTSTRIQMRQGLLKEQDIEICPIMEGVELLLVDGKEISRYLLITYVGWIANNDVERTDVSNQEIRLTDITVKRKGGSNFRYPAAARGDLRLIYIVYVGPCRLHCR